MKLLINVYNVVIWRDSRVYKRIDGLVARNFRLNIEPRCRFNQLEKAIIAIGWQDALPLSILIYY